MGHTSTYIDNKDAANIVRACLVKGKLTVDSASDMYIFNNPFFFTVRDISSAEKTDHGHIVLRFKKGGFVDFKFN